MKGILGRKKGMTEVFTTDGKLIPVTVIEVEDNVVSQIKTKETDGYDAIQLATVDKKEYISSPNKININTEIYEITVKIPPLAAYSKNSLCALSK